MKQCMSDGRMRFFIAAIIFLFTLTTVAQANDGKNSFKTELRKNGISLKLVRLDRTDGFKFGISFKNAQKQSVVIAPGLERMLLVISGDQEMILQADGSGRMQIIQALPELPPLFLGCLYQTFVDLQSRLALCQGLWACQITAVTMFVTDFISVINQTSSCLYEF